MSAPSLYHLSADMAALEDLLDLALESGAEADAAAIDAWLDELQGSLADKLGRVARWRATELALAAAGKAEAKRLTDRAKVREARVERVEAAVQALMERLGAKKVDTDVATFSLQKPGGKDPVVVVDDAVLPDDLVRVKREADKEAIRAALEAGRDVPGATIQQRGLVLRVK